MLLYLDEQDDFDQTAHDLIKEDLLASGWTCADDASLFLPSRQSAATGSVPVVSTTMTVTNGWLTGEEVLDERVVQRMQTNAITGGSGICIGQKLAEVEDAPGFMAGLRLHRITGFAAALGSRITCSPPPFPVILIVNFPTRLRRREPAITAHDTLWQDGRPQISDVDALESGAISIRPLTSSTAAALALRGWLAKLLPALTAYATGIPMACCDACDTGLSLNAFPSTYRDEEVSR